MYVKEINIPVPWGFIAAKCWGDEKNQPVIALHGFQDNAASFDTLIPLLPDVFYYICIDLPSHGKSSHLTTPTFITFFDFVTSLKLVFDHFNKKKYIVMGHSFGGQTAILVAQMFPEYVSKLISLDSYYYLPLGPDKVFHEYRGIIELYERQLSHSSDTCPIYTKEDAIKRMVDSRFSKISKKSAEIIVNRNLIPVEDGKYKISTAQHLKRLVRAPFGPDIQGQLLKNYPILCPHLVIMGKDSIVYKRYRKYIQKYVKKKKSFIYQVVPGDHDVHLENPERVAPIVTKFLLKQFNKL